MEEQKYNQKSTDNLTVRTMQDDLKKATPTLTPPIPKPPLPKKPASEFRPQPPNQLPTEKPIAPMALRPNQILEPTATPSARIIKVPEASLPETSDKLVLFSKPLFKWGLILGSLVIVIIAGTFGYLLLTKEPPSTQPSPSIFQPPPLPLPLFSMEDKEIIETTKSNLFLLPKKIQYLTEKNRPTGSFVHLIVENTENQNQPKYLSIYEIFEGLGIKADSLKLNCGQATSILCPEQPSLTDNLADEYSLFLFFHKESSPLAHSTSTVPVRLGLIIKIKESAKVKQILTDSQAKLISVFEPFFLGETPNQQTPDFKENIYKDVSVRYINLPDRFLSLDYAVFNQYLLITASKESALTAIDRTLEK